VLQDQTFSIFRNIPPSTNLKASFSIQTVDVSNPEPDMHHKDVTAKRQQCVRQLPQCRKPEQMEETM